MRPITLTTTIKNHATLSLLLKMTDQLVADGLLDFLRIVDDTPDDDGTEKLRSMLPRDGGRGTRIVSPDVDSLKKIDPTAHVATGVMGYSHKSTSLRLTPGGRSVYVMMKTLHGAYIAVSPEQRGPGNVEIVINRDRCFIRAGRGGGTPISVLDVASIGNGKGWSAVELKLDSENKLKVQLDTGEFMTTQLHGLSSSFVVSLSAPTTGVCDFIASYLSPVAFEKDEVINRNYVSYFFFDPPPVEDGLEFVSKADIVYINKNGWRMLVEEKAAPLILGDPAHCSIFKRLGVIKESKTSKQIHDSFLERSRGVIDKIISASDIPLNIEDSSLFYRTSKLEGLYPPALICCLQGRAGLDSTILAGYEKLFAEGPQGKSLPDKATDILLHVDSMLSSGGIEEFLSALLETLPREQQEFLLSALSRKLS